MLATASDVDNGSPLWTLNRMASDLSREAIGILICRVRYDDEMIRMIDRHTPEHNWRNAVEYPPVYPAYSVDKTYRYGKISIL